MLFYDYVELWKDKSRLRCGKGWRLCQDQVIRDHIIPLLPNLPLEEIRPFHISGVLGASRAKGHSDNQNKKIYMVLSKIFNDAIEEFELLTKSPVKKNLHLPKVKQIERGFMEPIISWAVLEYVMHNELFGPAVWLQFLTALRVGEVQALTWDDIDFKKNLIYVKQKYNRITGEIDKYTKNGKHHTAHIPPALRKYLLPKINQGFVCKNTTGGMMSYYSYKTFLSRLSKRLKLKITSSHGLRHSSAAYFKSLGATQSNLMSLLNHSSIQSLKPYEHGTDESLKNICKKIV